MQEDGSFSGTAALTKWKKSDKNIVGKFEGHFMGEQAQEVAGAAEFGKNYRAVFNASQDAEKSRYVIAGGKPNLKGTNVDCSGVLECGSMQGKVKIK